MSSIQRPSYKTGYAHDGSMSENPNLWDGLIGAWCPLLGPTGVVTHATGTDADRVWLPNLISGKKLTFVQEVTNLRFQIRRGSWVFRHAYSGVNYDTIESFASKVTTEASIFFRFRFLANSNVNGLPFSATTNRTHYLLSGSQIYSSVFSSTRVINGTSSSGMDVTSWHSLVITTKPGASNYKLYYNGKVFTTGTGPATVANMANGSLLRNNPADVNTGINGEFSAIYLYNRAISAREVRQLHVDDAAPLQLRRRASVLVPAAPPATTVPKFMHHYKVRRTA